MADWDEEDPEEYIVQPQATGGKKNIRDTTITKDTLSKYLDYSSKNALMSLTRPNGGLKTFLKKSGKSKEMVKLAVKCFCHACEGDLLNEGVNFLLSSILESTLIEIDLPLYVREEGSGQFSQDCVQLLLKLITKFPDEAANKLRLVTVLLMEQHGLKEETIRDLKTIDDLIKSATANESTNQRPSRQRPRSDDDVPPEDFRILTTIPTGNDIDVNIQPFLRKNRIQGRYDNCDQYLDVQFRLLREDLFQPLRESISEYQSHGGNSPQGISMIKVYNNVKLIRPICRNNGLGYRICFNVGNSNNINWDTSKRLIFGSLLCLSKDNFQNCVYATVVNKDKEDVINGLLDIRFELIEIEELNKFLLENRSSCFSMVESPAYYTPYKHVLLGMQNMHEDNFPFLSYVVEGETTIDKPAYLRKNSGYLYDLRPVVDPNFEIGESEYKFNEEFAHLQYVDIQDDKQWPSSQQLNLDDSQSVALRQALNREFSIIQGPPGTGKTHLGLNILKILLHNKAIWCPDGAPSTPIVVICYTNHALDQFLLGALDFFNGNMVRVGSRSQDEKIKEYNITNHRNRSRSTKKVSQAVHNSRTGLRDQLDSMRSEIEQSAPKLQIAHREILKLSSLEDEISERAKRQLNLNDESVLLRWLGIQQKLDSINNKYRTTHDQQEYEPRDDEADYVGDDNEYDDDDDDDDVYEQINQREMREMDDDDFLDLDTMTTQMKQYIMLLDVSSLDNVSTDFCTAEERKLRLQKQRELKKLKYTLRYKISADDRMSDEEARSVPHVWRMKYTDRWRLYRHWVRRFIEKISTDLIEKEIEYESTWKRYNEVLLVEDRDIIKEAELVGLTTTGAAKYQSVLADIGPKIIIFEEAAEVLEGHIVVNLSRHCEHAIFIGDHKQLQPNPTVHKLAKDYNLDISLFERLINNGIPFDTLNEQHRMRPEISAIMRTIYPHLQDHDVVKHYDTIKGVESNMAFINHSHPDETDEDSKTRVNRFEGDFLKCLCDYFLNLGYKKSSITILTTYSGQHAYINDILSSKKYNGVCVSTVDSYQGQENEIILLSLVRSGNEDNIGFLSKENRLCVAFSRAKMGFFVIGNFEHLQIHSPTLKEMVIKASKQGVVHDGIYLGCPNHTNSRLASSLDDFQISAGCLQPCNQRLKCGHACPLICHDIGDGKHESLQCLEDCARCCKEGHPCNGKCYEECLPCIFPVLKTLPRCGHEQYGPCHKESWKINCERKIKKTLPCGHVGEGFCSEDLPSDCKEMVEVDRSSCKHRTIVPCYQKDSDMCNHPCDTVLECEHRCSGTCSGCYKGRLHVRCQESCGRDLICGHICKNTCSFCPPCDETCINKCKHNGCTNPCGDECIPCNMKCTWQCKHFKCTKRCNELCNRDRCDMPCKKRLPCNDCCIGLCGEECPKLCRICDQKEVENTHLSGDEDVMKSRYIVLEDCNHVFEVNFMDKYMETSDDSTDDEVIAVKRCPMCKTHIILTPRYGNVIKTNFDRIRQVKAKIMGSTKRIKELQNVIEEKRRNGKLKEFIKRIYDERVKSEHHLAAVVSQIRIYEQIMSLTSLLLRVKQQLQLDDDCFKRERELLEDLEKWTTLKRTVFSKQEENDATKEIQRLRYLAKLCVGRERSRDEAETMPAPFMVRLCTVIKDIEEGFDDMKQLDDLLQTMYEYLPKTTLGIPEEERLQIIQAIGGRKGTWYACKNNHYYSIGDCGRAWEVSRCPECDEEIGGQQHTLAAGNVEAPEFDGADGPLHTEESDFLYALELQFG